MLRPASARLQRSQRIGSSWAACCSCRLAQTGGDVILAEQESFGSTGQKNVLHSSAKVAVPGRRRNAVGARRAFAMPASSTSSHGKSLLPVSASVQRFAALKISVPTLFRYGRSCGRLVCKTTGTETGYLLATDPERACGRLHLRLGRARLRADL